MSTPNSTSFPAQDQIDKQAIAYLKSLSSKPGNQDPTSSWYIIAACALTASGQGPLVAQVYLTAIESHRSNLPACQLIHRRIKEALLTTAFVTGIPRTLNAIFPLISALPNPQHADPLPSPRSSITNPYAANITARAEAYLTRVFGAADLASFLATLQEHVPDLRRLIVSEAYGMYQAETAVLGPVETSFINVASLVPMDCSEEVGWHLRGLVKNGGSREEAEMVVGVVGELMEIVGVRLRRGIPDLEDVVGVERLIPGGDGDGKVA